MKRASIIPNAEEVILLADKLTEAEVRLVVSNYYASQDARKRVDMQLRHLGDKAIPENFKLLNHFGVGSTELERTFFRSMERFAETRPVGRWILAQHGIGPVIAAGMIGHLDIEKAPTVSHFWRFSELDPSMKWEKKQKRPYNAAMKQLCYHLGECIKRTYKAEDSFYGQFYSKRKGLLVSRNDAGYNAERAKTFRTNSAEVKKLLAQGKLPAGNLDRQACNYVAKIFLSHLHAVMFWDKYHKAPPRPYGIAILEHAHEIKIPRIDMFPGFDEAYYGMAFSEAAE